MAVDVTTESFAVMVPREMMEPRMVDEADICGDGVSP
jgi:hypothetical protein